ncbi:hypothetical protein MLD38_014466 [Melastoma candidum]|uniref:Uncharacterized protein n=1 Tax=Melastoma candidum TaxID=119954 RepID=A0ACB9RD05_9MYRT|nr:hypothetical protein MLD38_014466 [Melastoma candidum]
MFSFFCFFYLVAQIMDDEGLAAEVEEDTVSPSGSDGFLEGFTAQELMNSSIEATMHDQNEEANQSVERKRAEVAKTNDAKSPDRVVQKKPRFIWTTEAHNQFLEAVRELGYAKAVPTKILALMNVEGLTRENVASHLQKFRLHIKKRHREMHGGCALPDEGRKNRSSRRYGISGNPRRSLVLPNTGATHARGECACFVQTQPVSSLSNQYGVYPFIQEVFCTPFKDMLCEKGVQGISSSGLEHGFYYNNYPYGAGELTISGPLPPTPLDDSYGYSFPHRLDNVSIVDQGVTSLSVNQNMENFSEALQSPRLLAGEFVQSPRYGGLDGGVVHLPRDVGLDGGLVDSPRGGGLRGGAVYSPVEAPGLDGDVHCPVEAPVLGGAVHCPVEVVGLDGGAFHYLVEEVPGHGWGGLRYPVEAPELADGGMEFQVEVPGQGEGSMKFPVEAPEPAGGGAELQVDEPGIVPENHLEEGNGNGGDPNAAYHPMLDADEEFFSFNAGAESPYNWWNFVQDMEDTGIDDLFK